MILLYLILFTTLSGGTENLLNNKTSFYQFSKTLMFWKDRLKPRVLLLDLAKICSQKKCEIKNVLSPKSIRRF